MENAAEPPEPEGSSTTSVASLASCQENSSQTAIAFEADQFSPASDTELFEFILEQVQAHYKHPVPDDPVLVALSIFRDPAKRELKRRQMEQYKEQPQPLLQEELDTGSLTESQIMLYQLQGDYKAYQVTQSSGGIQALKEQIDHLEPKWGIAWDEQRGPVEVAF